MSARWWVRGLVGPGARGLGLCCVLAATGLASSCGTMVESAVSLGSSRQDGGLVCDLSDPCNCARCTSTEECALGRICASARKRGESCPGALFVCTEP